MIKLAPYIINKIRGEKSKGKRRVSYRCGPLVVAGRFSRMYLKCRLREINPSLQYEELRNFAGLGLIAGAKRAFEGAGIQGLKKVLDQNLLKWIDLYGNR